MELKPVSLTDVHEIGVRALGLDPATLNLASEEALAAALRRAAGFLCPSPRGTLIQAVTRSLRGLIDDEGKTRDCVEDVLDSLVAYGDLAEHLVSDPENPTSKHRLIYLSPPQFVLREDGSIVIIGSIPDHRSPLPDDFPGRVEYLRHTRRIFTDWNESLAEQLLKAGFTEIPQRVWLRQPDKSPASTYIERLDKHLDVRPGGGVTTGLSMIDPESPVSYYRSRWIGPKGTGRFVGKRPQLYGNPIWCYVDVLEGTSQKFLDLPVEGSRDTGFDEAWRLQMAIDAIYGNHQKFEVRDEGLGKVVLHFSLPVPGWARRRWDYFGEPIHNDRSLFSYQFDETEVQEEIDFARQHLWMSEA